jgi:hypothetical protein
MFKDLIDKYEEESRWRIKDHVRGFFIGVVFILIGWLVFGHLVYQFRHPEQTSTQRFLNTIDALMFK